MPATSPREALFQWLCMWWGQNSKGYSHPGLMNHMATCLRHRYAGGEGQGWPGFGPSFWDFVGHYKLSVLGKLYRALVFTLFRKLTCDNRNASASGDFNIVYTMVHISMQLSEPGLFLYTWEQPRKERGLFTQKCIGYSIGSINWLPFV